MSRGERWPAEEAHRARHWQTIRPLGGDYFDHLNAQRLTRYHTQRLAALGYAVTLTKSAA